MLKPVTYIAFFSLLPTFPCYANPGEIWKKILFLWFHYFILVFQLSCTVSSYIYTNILNPRHCCLQHYSNHPILLRTLLFSELIIIIFCSISLLIKTMFVRPSITKFCIFYVSIINIFTFLTSVQFNPHETLLILFLWNLRISYLQPLRNLFQLKINTCKHWSTKCFHVSLWTSLLAFKNI